MKLKSKKLMGIVLGISMMMTSLVGCSDAVEKKDTIRISTTGMHPKFSQKNDKGELEGFEIDVWNEIAKRSNKEIEWVEADFTGMIGMLDSDRADVVANQISITTARTEKYEFSDVYFHVPYYLVVAEGNDSIKSLEDLHGKKIGLSLNDASYEFIKKLDPEGKIELVTYGQGGNASQDVADGRIDATVTTRTTFEDKVKKSGVKVKMTGKALYVEDNAYPFKKTEEGKELCKDVNKILGELKEEGFMKETAMKWFGYDPMEEE